MSRYNIIVLIAAAGVLALAGCNKEPEVADGGNITIEASVGAMTKVSYDGDKTGFTDGDQIAVFGWTGDATAVPATRGVDGVVNTLGTDGKWTPESPMLWKPGLVEHYFLGVYPARAIADFTADDYTLDPSKYTESDLLVANELSGITPTNAPIDLAFTHVMAKLVVNLKFRSQWDAAPAVGSVTANAKRTAKVNYLTKAVTATGDAAAVDIPAAATVPSGYDLSFSGLQVPQEGVRKVTITIGTEEYVYESATDIPLVSGQYTTLGLVLGKDKIELSGVTVGDWETGADLPGGEAEIVKKNTRYLTFTSEGTSRISLSNSGINAPKLYYSKNASDWTEWDYSELTFTKDAPLYLCGDNPDGFSFGFQHSSFNEGAGDNYSVTGDIMSLIDKDTECTVVPSKSCFFQLFNGCVKLTAAPSLGATTLADYCCEEMFAGCTGLTAAPELPATTLANCCYEEMFYGCTGLTVAPELPATTLTKQCYYGMFKGCTSLTTAPKLPATTLAKECYFSMFLNCTSLTTAPELPATTLAESCYRQMFVACTSLTAAPELPATTLVDMCYNYMFYGCRKLSYVKCLASNVGTENTEEWLLGVSSSGTFVKRAGETSWSRGESGIPSGWAVPEAVDLGLSVKWASFNVGATKPEEYGDYFAWGETAPKSEYNCGTYFDTDDGGNSFTKYTTGKKTALEAEDDAATANWGAPWRMPTDAEFKELLALENQLVENYNGSGINGYTFTGNGNTIFLPAAGRRSDTYLNFVGSHGDYWSSSLNAGIPDYAFCVDFSSGNVIKGSGGRYNGFSVRPVSE